MNPIQKALAWIGLVFVLAQLLFPPWDLQWTTRFDYEYYYEGDLHRFGVTKPADLPEDVIGHGKEAVSYVDSRRAVCGFGPSKPHLKLPPQKVEQVGVGYVDFGRRVTTYTKATLDNFKVTLLADDLVVQVLVTLGSMAVLVLMFGSPTTRLTTWTLPMDSYRHVSRLKGRQPEGPAEPPPSRTRKKFTLGH